MFVQVAVILAGVETAILLFDEEEWGCLGRVRRTDLSAIKVFLEEVFGGFVFVGQEWVNLPNFGSKGVIEVDFMVIGSCWWDMVSGFFGEDRGKVGEFGGKDLFGFGFFSGYSKFSGGGDFGYFLL